LAVLKSASQQTPVSGLIIWVAVEGSCPHAQTSCKDLLSLVLPLESDEREFLDRLNDRGEIAPALLTDAAGLRTIYSLASGAPLESPQRE
jgi:hypothetical protein